MTGLRPVFFLSMFMKRGHALFFLIKYAKSIVFIEGEFINFHIIQYISKINE